jgi:hypothetical protein
MFTNISCPAFYGSDINISDEVYCLYQSIEHFITLQPSAVASIGLEQRAALLALQGFDFGIVPDNDSWKAKCQSLFIRPAVENSIHFFRNVLDPFDLSQEIVDQLIIALTGIREKQRQGRSFGASINGDVEFETLEQSVNWMNDCNAVTSSNIDQRLIPFYIYARTISAHPYQDGNGRLARFLFVKAMGRVAGTTNLFLPIAISFYMHANVISSKLKALSCNSDWNGFIECITIVVNDAIKILVKTMQYAG